MHGAFGMLRAGGRRRGERPYRIAQRDRTGAAGAESTWMEADARRLIATRGLRGLADGVVSVLLSGYLLALGLEPFAVGALATATMLGSAALTIAVGVGGLRLSRTALFSLACGLMALTGLGFASLRGFWPLLVVAVVGTLNPSAGDVSVFLPLEQAALADATAPRARAWTFALYNVVGSAAAGVGALAGGVPELLARSGRVPFLTGARISFALYGLIGLVVAALYRRLGSAGGAGATTPPPAGLSGPSRGMVLKLAALFSLDSFGGGFVVQALLVLWLHQRFGVTGAQAGTLFFAVQLLAAVSQLVSGRIAARVGYIQTMVFTHLPANAFLIAAGLATDVRVAVALLLLRAALSSMDVPARQAYVMAVVAPAERAAASSLTNVPRSLAAAVPPLFTGALLTASSLGWPLVVAGALKALYDLLLLAQFRHVPPQQAP
jgi:MFS family permease